MYLIYNLFNKYKNEYNLIEINNYVEKESETNV